MTRILFVCMGNICRSPCAEGVMKLFIKLHKAGNTIIMVTHETDIAAYSKRIIRLMDGNIDRNSGQHSGTNGHF